MNAEESDLEVPVTSLDRFLAVTSLAIIVISVICFFAVIIGSVVGADFASPVWIAVSWVLYVGLPVGVLMFFTLLISNTVRRAKLAKAARGNLRA